MILSMITFLLSKILAAYACFRDKFLWIFFGSGSGGARKFLEHIKENSLTDFLTFAVLILSLVAGVQKIAILYQDYKLKQLELAQKEAELLRESLDEKKELESDESTTTTQETLEIKTLKG